MPLRPGTRLGPYEILSLLGEGGMGQVYRARDTRLDRLVAVKVVSEAAVGGELALERFEREARVASALNHPNICTIYDVGPTYLVMELLDGETLQQRLTRGPLHVAAIIDFGIALADALEAAHAAGIIHRDIKPANIFIAARGPKILDFGLAKTAPVAAAVSSSETIAVEALQTQPGSTVGTIAYMSPEQLRGEPLDQRSDLFSLGLVLYEMAAGRPAFTGATSAVISAAILHRDPVPPRQLRAEVPERLDEVIMKALEKDRETRCQTAAELRADLKRLKRESDSRQVLNATVAIPSLAESPAPPPVPSHADIAPARPPSAVTPPAPASDADLVAAAVFRKFRNTFAVVVGGAAVAVALAILIADRWYAAAERPGRRPPAPVTGPTSPPARPNRPDTTTLQAGPASSSPQLNAAATPPAAAVRSATPPNPAPVAGDGAAIPLTTSGAARRPAIAADGSLVAYLQQQGDTSAIWIHRMADGSNRALVPSEEGVQLIGVTVAPDGSFVDYVKRTTGPPELWRAAVAGGTPQRLVDRIDSLTAWSPDGQQMAFVRVLERTQLMAVLLVADKSGRNE